MTLIGYKIIAGLCIFLIALATAYYTLLKKQALTHLQSIELGEAFASGIFLGMAFFHMLPDAIQAFSHLNHITYPIPEIICLGSFLLFLFLERLALVNGTHHSLYSIPYMLILILVIHALVEGAALGISNTFSEAIILFIAILAHKGSESFALCITLLRHNLSFQRSLHILVFFACVTPIGISFGALINEWIHARYGEWTAAIYNAFAAGTFLYMSTLHHIHFHQHAEEKQGLQELLFLTLGLVITGAMSLSV